MLRKNILFNNGRVSVDRFYFIRNLSKTKHNFAKEHQKFYIVQVKNEQTALVKAHQTQKALVEDSIKEDHWHRLRLILTEILYVYRNQFSLKMKELQVNERFLEMKKQHTDKLAVALTQENVKKIIETTQNKLKTFEETKSYEKIKQLPQISNDLISKGNQYWILFNESKHKELIVYYIQMGKKGIIEVFKFIKHVYNAPSK